MNKVIVSLLVAAALISCEHDDAPVETTTNVSFVVNGTGLGAGRIAGLTPEKVVVSIEDKDGKVILDNKTFNLVAKENSYETEVIVLSTGDYRVTKYIVVSGKSAAYVTPRSGSVKAEMIDKPLPFDFTVTASNENSVAPKIIGVSSQDNPRHFGYNDFGYEIPDGGTEDSWYNVRIKIEMIVGEIYYQNLDAFVRVIGFNEEGDIKWGQTYIYTGPEANDVAVKNGFHHYTIEVEKWDKTLAQSYSAASLMELRVREGQVPTTQVFQTDIEPKRVASATSSFTKDLNGAKVLMPVSRVNYEYKLDGRVSSIDYETWSENLQKFVNSSESLFYYEGARVQKIVNIDIKTDAIQSEDHYTYDVNGDVTHIQHKDNNGITTEVDLEHLYTDRVVRAKYRLSNGSGFDYEFINQYGSLKSDKTTRGGQLCSEATYTSDKSINPLKHLGYVDYLMRNYSASNKVTESANYVGCSFPALIPERYSYVYNDYGYPVRATTHYKGTDSVNEVEYTYYQD